MSSSLDLVFFGLSLSSSWGNGHATTYRALLKGLAHENHRALFLECDQPWYAGRRDLEEPPYCELALYESLSDIAAWRERIEAAHAVIVGSYVPQGAALLDLLLSWAPRRLLFYDIDTPVTLAALSEGTCTYLEERQLPELDLYLSFAGGNYISTAGNSGSSNGENGIALAGSLGLDTNLSYQPTLAYIIPSASLTVNTGVTLTIPAGTQNGPFHI